MQGRQEVLPVLQLRPRTSHLESSLAALPTPCLPACPAAPLPCCLQEPALNPALEEQAIGRAWRMGQQREVTVKKFYVKVGARVVERWGQCCALYV